MAIQYLCEHESRTALQLPLFATSVPAGFPSPADDYIDKSLDLNEYLIQHPAATFYCRVSGHSLTGIGIFDGDLLIVDRSLTPLHEDVVLAIINGELACKILDLHGARLLSANDEYSPITVGEGSAFQIDGVVIHSIRSHRVRPN